MAGRIFDNVIVPGYPEPGVTADEIVGLVNKYGLALSGYSGVVSKTYSEKTLVELANDFVLIGPSRGETILDLEEWPIESNIIASVAVNAVTLALPHPYENNDDNTSACVEIQVGDESSASCGTIGQSVIHGTDPVAFQGNFECLRVDTIPAGVGVRVTGKFFIYGTGMTYVVDGGGVVVYISIKVIRVAK